MPRTRLLLALGTGLALVAVAVAVVLFTRAHRDAPAGPRPPATAQDHAREACRQTEAALAAVTANRPAKRVFDELDQADREARAAVTMDPIYTQLASSVVLIRTRVREDSTEGLPLALDLMRFACSLASATPFPQGR